MIPFRYLQLLIIQFTKGNILMTGTLERILENLEWILLSLIIIWSQYLLLLNAPILFYVFFWGSEVLNFSQLLEGVASLLAEKFTWNYTLGGKKRENCLIRSIFQPTNPFLIVDPYHLCHTMWQELSLQIKIHVTSSECTC